MIPAHGSGVEKDAPAEMIMQSPLFRQVHRLLQIISEAGTAGVKFSQAVSGS